MNHLIELDLVDDFAASAMSGMMTNWRPGGPLKLHEVARVSYEVALEMAKARGTFIQKNERILAPSPDTEGQADGEEYEESELADEENDGEDEDQG